MRVTTMTQMWALLQAHTLDSSGGERPVNPLNEWGGFSRWLGMPVFTGWFDHATYDKASKTTTALVLDEDWGSAVGLNNQRRWIDYALSRNNGVAAFFVIHAADPRAERRKVKYIDDDKVFVGPLARDGRLVRLAGLPRPL